MKKKNLLTIILLAVVLAAGITVYSKNRQRVILPMEQDRGSFNPVPPSPSPNPQVTLPSQINLKVPFTSQAPHQNWEDPYGEFCEEASALMAAFYLQNKTIPNADFADRELLNIMNFEIVELGYHLDTTAEETALILKKYFNISQVKLVNDPTVNQIKEALSQGKVVITPAAGRMLDNPNFTAPGPLYHMLVIKGYTADGKFITNDPGTRKGADFLYEYDNLMNAIHDWNDGDVLNGKRVVIVVG
jgi:hypothetical protein